MKIKFNGIFEDLTEYKYIYRRDVFRKKNLYYKYMPKCEVCGEPYFMRISYKTSVCSNKCSKNLKAVREKISKSLKGIKRSKEECAAISARMSKGEVVKRNIPLFATFAHQLSDVEEVRDNNGLLEVKCSFCKNWFIPKRTEVEARAQFIKGNIDRESRLYCSQKCKERCPIFKKKKYPKGSNPRGHRNKKYNYTENELRVWSKEVLARADNICEFCGETATIAHHEQPKKLQPFFALDPDNGIACCEKCHYKYGHTGDCSTASIAYKLCE